MARFPETEPEVAALAKLVAQGLAEMTEDFPAPPVPAEELQARHDAFQAAGKATVDAEFVLRQQHAVKDRAHKSLVEGLKVDLKYAEAAVRDQPEKLSKLGWGPRRGRNSLEAPGEVRDARIVSEGDTWVILSWDPPVGGGQQRAYKIQRKQQGGTWEDVGTSVDTKQLLNGQPRGVELNYRVIAMNKAGEGTPSATVTLVL